jgi:vacuolar-type H+-ATPase subunit E/Vma4
MTACWLRSEYSKQLNESRLKVLQAREGNVHGLVKDAHARLMQIAANKKAYKGLLTDLTVQVGQAYALSDVPARKVAF